MIKNGRKQKAGHRSYKKLFHWCVRAICLVLMMLIINHQMTRTLPIMTLPSYGVDISPDGEQLIVTATSTGDFGFRIIDLATQDIVQEVSLPDRAGTFKFTPSGDVTGFQMRHKFFEYSLNEGALTQYDLPLLRGSFNFAYHPSKRIIAVTQDDQILLYDLEERNVIQEIPIPEGSEFPYMAWSPSGDYLAFGYRHWSWATNDDRRVTIKLFVVDANNGENILYLEDLYVDFWNAAPRYTQYLSWHPDETLLGFGSTILNVQTMSEITLDGQGGGGGFVFSDSGEYIYTMNGSSHYSNLVRWDSNTGEMTKRFHKEPHMRIQYIIDYQPPYLLTHFLREDGKGGIQVWLVD